MLVGIFFLGAAGAAGASTCKAMRVEPIWTTSPFWSGLRVRRNSPLRTVPLAEPFAPGWRLLTSPYQVLGNVQSYIFGFGDASHMALPSFLLLVAASVVSVAILFRRVNAPMRA